MNNVVRPNTIHKSNVGEPSNSWKHPSDTHHYPPDGSKTLFCSETLKTDLVKEAPVPEQAWKTVIAYFCHHPKSSLTEAGADIATPYCPLHTILKVRIHMFPYKIPRVNQIQPQDYAKRAAFSHRVWTTCPLISVTTSACFFCRMFFTSQDFGTLRPFLLETRKPRRIPQLKLHSEKVTAWCAVHVIVLLSQ